MMIRLLRLVRRNTAQRQTQDLDNILTGPNTTYRSELIDALSLAPRPDRAR